MFQWDPIYGFAYLKKFDSKAWNILKRTLYDMREGRTHSGFVFMGAANLAKMRAKWASPDWQRKSEAGHDARTSKKGKGKAVYTGGSVSTTMHKSRIVSIYSYKWFLVFCSIHELKSDKCVLLQAQKRKLEGSSDPVSMYDVFIHTKVRKKDGAWISRHTRRVVVNHL